MMERVVDGGVSGFLATIPMSVVMLALHEREPKPVKRRPLPPAEITREVAEEAGVRKYLGPKQEQGLIAVAHFSYGTICGAIFGVFSEPRSELRHSSQKTRYPSTLRSGAFGLLVWAASYLGWVPLAGLMPPATRQAGPRNALMIASHIVWGLSLSLFIHEMRRVKTREMNRKFQTNSIALSSQTD